MVRLLLILILLLPVNAFGALVYGTNAGFVTVAPVADPGASNTGFEGYAFGTQHTLPADATTITEIGFWVNDQEDGGLNFEVGIYDDDGSDYPSNAIARDQTNVMPTGNFQWVNVTGLSIDVASHQGTLLWATAQIDPGSGVDVDFSGNDEGVSERVSGQTTLTDPFVDGSPANTRIYAVYAVYTTGEAPAVPQNRGYIIGLLSLDDWKEMMGV